MRDREGCLTLASNDAAFCPQDVRILSFFFFSSQPLLILDWGTPCLLCNCSFRRCTVVIVVFTLEVPFRRMKSKSGVQMQLNTTCGEEIRLQYLIFARVGPQCFNEWHPGIPAQNAFVNYFVAPGGTTSKCAYSYSYEYQKPWKIKNPQFAGPSMKVRVKLISRKIKQEPIKYDLIDFD